MTTAPVVTRRTPWWIWFVVAGVLLVVAVWLGWFATPWWMEDQTVVDGGQGSISGQQIVYVVPGQNPIGGQISGGAIVQNQLVDDHSAGVCTQELAIANVVAQALGIEFDVYGDALNACHIAVALDGLNAQQRTNLVDTVGGQMSPGAYALVGGTLQANQPNPPSLCSAVTIAKWYRSGDVTSIGHLANLCN